VTSSIIVHGGAGSHQVDQNKEVLNEAARAGGSVLESGGSALDAVEDAVNVLEEHPDFNAGKGAKLQLDGVIRLEASVMTSNLEVGAVTGLQEIENAVSVARQVMERTHHSMLGNGFATRFATKCGFEKSDLQTRRTIEQYREVKDEVSDLDFDETLEMLKDRDTSGTVGCVAAGPNGELAAATSTGGRSSQLAGRIGDSPQVGSGTYCDSQAAVSATGIGEAILKTTLSRRCRDNIAEGMSPKEAAEKAIEFLDMKTGREAGLIVVDADGSLGSYHNAEEMHTSRREYR
jgi:beta-aspartyl-peptidase (threonine type)